MSTLRGRYETFLLVIARFSGLLLDFVGDCTIILSTVVAILVHP